MSASCAGGAAVAAPTEGRVRRLNFVTRSHGMTHDEFVSAVLQQGRAAASLPGLTGLVLSEIMSMSPPFALSGLDIDGMLELWTKSDADYAALMASPAGKSWWAATDALFSRNTTFVSREHTFIPVPPREGTDKTVTLIVRKDGTTHEAYMQHWLGTHGPMATEVEVLKGFVLNELKSMQPAKGGLFMPEVDGISEVWWDAPAGTSLAPLYRTPQVQNWFADGNLFIQRDKSRNMVARAHVLVPVQ